MERVLFFCLRKKRVAPATQDATQPADEIRNGEKVCFFCKFLQGISKKSKHSFYTFNYRRGELFDSPCCFD